MTDSIGRRRTHSPCGRPMSRVAHTSANLIAEGWESNPIRPFIRSSKEDKTKREGSSGLLRCAAPCGYFFRICISSGFSSTKSICSMASSARRSADVRQGSTVTTKGRRSAQQPGFCRIALILIDSAASAPAMEATMPGRSRTRKRM